MASPKTLKLRKLPKGYSREVVWKPMPPSSRKWRHRKLRKHSRYALTKGEPSRDENPVDSSPSRKSGPKMNKRKIRKHMNATNREAKKK